MNAYIYESFDSVTVECHGNSMNQVIQVGSEEVGAVAVAVEEVDGQVGEVEDMAMVDMMSLTPWLCPVTRWDFDHFCRKAVCCYGAIPPVLFNTL